MFENDKTFVLCFTDIISNIPTIIREINKFSQGNTAFHLVACRYNIWESQQQQLDLHLKLPKTSLCVFKSRSTSE